MEDVLFTGAATALVTPFLNGKINFPMVEQLLKRQIDAGIRTIVLSGTTGESATLSDQEKLELVARAKAYTGDSCQILAGTGSNDTRHALALSQAAQAAGADGLLVVTPYYNKATAEGLVAHYSTIAAGVELPIVLYNVPSRTGVDMSVAVCQCLSQLPNIVGIKEASTDMVKICQLHQQCPPNFGIWSGNDDLIAPVMALGGKGVISVLSNLLPEVTQALAQAALAGDFDTAADLQGRLLPLIQALFRQVNPIPVKAAMKLLGYDCGPCRLPLTPLPLEQRAELKKLLSQW